MTLPPKSFDLPFDIRCPACGYSAVADARCSPMTDMPETRDDVLEYFNVLGADEGCVFCPKCTCEFQPDESEIATTPAERSPINQGADHG